MKKIILTVLAAVCFLCLGLAFACNNESVYYVLTFSTNDGVKIVSETAAGEEVRSGSKIKKNTEIYFTLEIDEAAEGEPAVTLNGSALTAGGEGVYSFKITEDTVIEVTGVYLPGGYTVTFDTQNNDFIKFNGTDGSELDTLEADGGTEVSFTVYTSVYYGNHLVDEDGMPTYSVVAGSLVIKPVNGVYTFTVSENTTVKVNNIPVDLAPYTFLQREADGDEDGSAEHPFTIREAADLYVMSDCMASTFDTTPFYRMAYYRLNNDIDMKGEKLFIIGDTTSSLSVFAGMFDGNGHTISNYIMTDTLIEQSAMTEVHLPFVGLFGFASMAVICNLTLENFEIRVDGELGANVFVGAIAGCGRGVDIVNCSVINGEIIAHGDPDQSSFVGGILGTQESFVDENDESHPSIVRSCYSDVAITAASGFIYSAGGITGFLYTGDPTVTAAIYNCYSSSNLQGAARSGGIVGSVNPYSSVKNCYATGRIESANHIAEYTGSAAYSRAYAGGIAGYAESDSIISNCFFTGATYASALAGSSFAFSDGIVGGADEDETTYINTKAALVYYCYSTAQSSVHNAGTVTNITDDFLKNTLGWTEYDWEFKGNGLPVINKDDVENSFTVTIKTVDGDVAASFDVDSVYISMGYWYFSEDGVSEFLGEGSRTYGYFFDEQLTLKVPYGYVPTTDITFYTEYVDYTKVAGDYYILSSQSGNRVYLSLSDNGIYEYRDGARIYSAYYTFDGTTIILNAGPAAQYEVNTGVNEDGTSYVTETYFLSAKAQYAESGNMTFAYKYVNTINTVNETFEVVKKLDGFHYGSYWDANNAEYTFYEDGTGIRVSNNNTVTAFTFTVNGTVLNITMGSNAARVGKIVDGYVTEFDGANLTPYDNFKGVWEKSFGSYKQFEFDGKGIWSYVYFGYNADGVKQNIAVDGGTYTVDAGKLMLAGGELFADGTVVTIDGGVLDIDGANYYPEYSFVGTWRFAGRPEKNAPIEISFEGIGENGYGVANVTYFPAFYGELQLSYETVVLENGNITIMLYSELEPFGLLTFNKADKTLTGSFYSALDDAVLNNVLFCLRDDYYGTWECDELGTVVINGYGNYSTGGSVNYMPTEGNVNINGKNVKYTLENGTLCGSFNYDGKTYSIEYDETNDEIIVACEGEEFTLTRVEE